jgi:hypothetical protein
MLRRRSGAQFQPRLLSFSNSIHAIAADLGRMLVNATSEGRKRWQNNTRQRFEVVSQF